MNVVIAGGTGLLGSALTAALRLGGHAVSVLTRGTARTGGQIQWSPDRPGEPWADVVRSADVVVNLAGASLAGPRWTEARKTTLVRSRVDTTTALARVIAAAGTPPAFVSGSAVGFYGAHGDEPLTEEAPAGDDFLARLCVDWERAAGTLAGATRVTWLRTGVVLSRAGGALPELARPFHFFVGGPIGSGNQYVSWIHIDDWTSLALMAIADATLAGPINLTAPHPVRNRELAQALGRALRRPSIVPAPAWPVRLALGEMADAAILNGQRVLPARAEASGYRFKYPTIGAALAAIYSAGND
jgi:uncharacterized protein (TIGR01777 family)